jgi:hypothetical protein
MRRIVSDRCASCGLPLVIGPKDVDYIKELQRRGLERTLRFDYLHYMECFDHSESACPKEEITSENCDSLFLGELIDIDMKCPKCGGFAFAEDDSG